MQSQWRLRACRLAAGVCLPLRGQHRFAAREARLLFPVSSTALRAVDTDERREFSPTWVTISRMLEELDALAAKLHELAGQMQALRTENRDLRARLAATTAELEAMRSRMTAAAERIDALLARLPADEQGRARQ